MVSGSIDGTIALWETSRERIEVAWRHDLSVKMGRSLSTPPPILLASVNCGKKINDLISVMPSGDNITVFFCFADGKTVDRVRFDRSTVGCLKWNATF